MAKGFLNALLLGVLLLAACTPERFFTVTIYDERNRFVRLQAVSMTDSQGYTHPASISEKKIAAVMRGLVVERYASTIPIPLLGGSESTSRSLAFSEKEVTFFAPLLAKGLEQATPEEIVTFFTKADYSNLLWSVTSGGMFVKDGTLHVILSNYKTHVEIEQDVEQYQAPYRLTPMEAIKPEPGRLMFQPRAYMVEVDESGLDRLLTGQDFHVAVRYRDLPVEDGGGEKVDK